MITEKSKRRLFRCRGVVMVVEGIKSVKGVDIGEIAVVVGVVKKLPLSKLALKNVVPPVIDGLRTDVIEEGEIFALYLQTKADEEKGRTER